MKIPKIYQNTVIIGKFMPAHNGHINMINFASKLTRNLTVLVDNVPSNVEKIPLIDRVNILKKEFDNVSNIKIVPIDIVTYQEPSESDNFWEFWKNTILRNSNNNIDSIIGSEDYVKTLGSLLNIEYLIFDKKREQFNVSATKVRNLIENIENSNIRDLKNNKYLNELYQYIPTSTLQYYQKNISINGTECVGKSEFIKKCQLHYNMGQTLESATFLFEEEPKLNKDFFKKVLSLHCANLNTNLNNNYINLIDNSIFVTAAYYEYFFKEELDLLPYIEFENNINNYILFTLNETVPYKNDTHRLGLSIEDRKLIQDLIEKYFNKYNINYTKINGVSFEEKLDLFNYI